MLSIGKFIYSTFSSKENVDKYQKIIRDYEWNMIKTHIPKNSIFLDIGCGTGYTIERAKKELNCRVFGVDPNPGGAGVGRFDSEESHKIVQYGLAEDIPFEDKYFDIVFSSHVLEHVEDELMSLKEMNRVLKDEGLLIIGMPTALMSYIRFFSNVVFTTHIKIYEFIKNIHTKNILNNFIKIFHVGSHSYPRSNTIFYDLNHYRVNNWKKIINVEFDIIKTIEPCLYPYPDYIQFFKLHKSRLGSSSVFFICKKII